VRDVRERLPCEDEVLRPGAPKQRAWRSLACVVVACTILRRGSCRPVSNETMSGDSRTLRVVNREVTKVEDRNGVRLSARSGYGVAWVEGTELRSGTITVDVRGREELSQHYVGIAFHRTNGTTCTDWPSMTRRLARARTARRGQASSAGLRPVASGPSGPNMRVM
jgi:hypothetical protein